MAGEAKIEIVKRETIKPSMLFSQNQIKSLKLSHFYQLSPPVYIPLVLFYPKNNDITVGQKAQQLKKSPISGPSHSYQIHYALKSQFSLSTQLPTSNQKIRIMIMISQPTTYLLQ